MKFQNNIHGVKGIPLKQARLDFFFVSEALMSSIDDINIFSSYRSDHSTLCYH